MADPRHFPEKQGGQYDAGGYYTDDQREYPQSGYERREYINSGQTERSQYTSEGSTYDNYSYQQQQHQQQQHQQHQQQQHQQYGDQNHGYSSPGYSSPGYAPTDAYRFPSPAYGSEHEYSGGGYYSPPPLSPTSQPPPISPSGQPPDMYYKSDNYDNYDNYDPHASVDNYQKPQFDVYNDFNNMSPPPQDHEPSDAHTTYASSTRPFGSSKENADLSDPMRNSIAAQRLPVKKQRRRCCHCCRCCTWKVCVITTFIILIVLAIVGFFVFPRVPKVTVVKTKGIGKNGTLSSTRINIKFDLVVQVDNEANWIPFHFNKVEVRVFNRVATQPVGSGNLTDYQLKPRRTTFIDLPLRIFYWGNDTDPVISDFISACGEGVPERTLMNLDTTIKLFIWGIDLAYKPTIRTGSSDLECPYELPVGDLPADSTSR